MQERIPWNRSTFRKTKKMLAVEERLGINLATDLHLILSDMTVSEAADLFQITTTSLGYWITKLGLIREAIYLAPGDVILIKRKGSSKIEERTHGSRNSRNLVNPGADSNS